MTGSVRKPRPTTPLGTKKRLELRTARLVLYGGSVLLGLVPPVLSLWDSVTSLALMMLSAWTVHLAAAVLLQLYAARRGVSAFEACWPPVVCYAVGWLALRLLPPGVPVLLGLALGILGASAGQELHKRRPAG